MHIPLFKEIEKEVLFSLIPKISLDFESFPAKSILFDLQTEVSGLVYLIKGTVLMKNKEKESSVSGPALISWTGVFGRNRHHSFVTKALTECSVLNVDKRSLVFLIRHEPAFMEAYLDLLADAV